MGTIRDSLQERVEDFYSIRMNLHLIEDRLHYCFKNKNLLLLAFTHRSYFNENRKEADGHNERLEFLGDAVLGLVVSCYLYKNLPLASEGHLSHLKAYLVGADSCVEYTRYLVLEEFLRLGRGESFNKGKGREKILADLFEAIVGAIFLDGGLASVEEFLLFHFTPFFEKVLETTLRNWKAELQDYSQKRYQKPPDYEVIEEKGPPHSKTFLISVRIGGEELGQGQGSSKKQAEQAAAEDALRRIEKRENNGEN